MENDFEIWEMAKKFGKSLRYIEIWKMAKIFGNGLDTALVFEKRLYYVGNGLRI